MIRGLEKGLRPFIKRIIVEDGFQNPPNNRTQYDEYYNSAAKDDKHSINLTMDFCIKKQVHKISDTTFSSISSVLSSYTLQVQFINNKDELNKFITSTVDEKIIYLKANENREIPISTKIIQDEEFGDYSGMLIITFKKFPS